MTPLLSFPVQQRANAHAACKSRPQSAFCWIHVKQQDNERKEKLKWLNHARILMSYNTLQLWSFSWQEQTGVLQDPNRGLCSTWIPCSSDLRVLSKVSEFVLRCFLLFILAYHRLCSHTFIFTVHLNNSASRRKPSLTSKSHWMPLWYLEKSRDPLWWPSTTSGTVPLSMPSWARR